MDHILQALSFLPGFHNAHSHDITFLFMPGSEEKQSNCLLSLFIKHRLYVWGNRSCLNPPPKIKDM